MDADKDTRPFFCPRWDTEGVLSGLSLDRRDAPADYRRIPQNLIQIKDEVRPTVHAAGMTTQVHGHEVMQMMLELDQSFTRDTLREAIQNRFGGETRFFTCSAENMTPDELIDFLAERGKFVERDSGFSTQADRICQH